MKKTAEKKIHFFELILNGVIFALCFILIMTAQIFFVTQAKGKYFDETTSIIFNILAVFFLFSASISNHFYILKRSTVFLVFYIISLVGLIPGAVLNIVFTGGAYGWLCLGACALRFGVYDVTVFLKRLSNPGYRGDAPVKYWRKLLEPFLQIALLPISVFINVLWMPYIVWFAYKLSNIISYYFFFGLLKGEWRKVKQRYNVGESTYQKKVKVEHDIKDADGNKIGSYETEEYETVYDDGDRVEYGNEVAYNMAFFYGLCAIPFRLCALFLSVVALFVPHMYISATKIKTNRSYNKPLFLRIDAVLFNET